MADLKFTVDFTEVKTAAQNVQDLKKGVASLSAAYKAGNITYGQYISGINQLSGASKRLGVDINQTRSTLMLYGNEKQRQIAVTDALAKAENRLGVAVQGSTRRIAANQVMTQQAGYQIGDFIVQVQSGTNAFVAFGQQATQVAGTLTLLGGKMVPIGAALSIIIPLATAFGAALMRTRQDAEDTVDTFEELRQRTHDLRNEIAALQGGFGEDVGLYLATTQLEVLRQTIEAEEERLRVATQTGDLYSDLGIAENLEDLREQLRIQEEVVANLEEEKRQREAIREAERQAQRDKQNAESAMDIVMDLDRQLRLQEAIRDHGEDSLSFALTQMEVEEEIFRQRLESLGLEEARLTNIIELWRRVWGLTWNNEQRDPPTVPTRSGSSRRPDKPMDLISKEVQALADAYEALTDQQNALFESANNSMQDFFMDTVSGTESVVDAFRNMSLQVVSELYKVLVVQRLVGSYDVNNSLNGSGIMGLIGPMFSMRASGGSMSPGNPYLVGERGPELVVPSTGSTVLNSDLTSKALSSSSSPVVNISYSFQGGVTESDLSRAIPVLVNQTKRAIIDEVQRGGSTSRVFR